MRVSARYAAAGVAGLAVLALAFSLGTDRTAAQAPSAGPTITVTPNANVAPTTALTPGSIVPSSTAAIQMATPQPGIQPATTPRPATGPAVPRGGPAAGGAQLPSVEITPADAGKTVQIAIGQQVIIRMGTDLGWTVDYQPPGILTAVPGVNALVRGVQGILRAQQAGTVQVVAQGKAHCDPGQACPQFITLVSVTVVINAAGSTSVQSPAPTTTSGGTTVAPRPPTGVALPNTGTGPAPTNAPAVENLLIGGLLFAVAVGGAVLLGRRPADGLRPR